MIAFRTFLETGRLGQVTPGESTGEAVRDVFGPPAEISTGKNPEIWRYGGLQFTFYRGPGDTQQVLTAIGIFFDDPEPGFPDVLALDSQIELPLDIAQFRRYLEDCGLQVHSSVVVPEEEVYEGVVEPSRATLVLDSGVRATFLGGQLHNLFFTSKSRPRGKQMTLFVPEEVLEQARKVAEVEPGASVSSICTRWLVQHAKGQEVVEPPYR
jgi:hypothetical protein